MPQPLGIIVVPLQVGGWAGRWVAGFTPFKVLRNGLHLKLCTSWLFTLLPHMSLPTRKRLSKLGTFWVQTLSLKLLDGFTPFKLQGMWVNRKSDPLCDFELWPHLWPWPSIFKVKFWKSCISGMGGSIDIERKWCELIGCWTHFVTLSYDLDLGLSTSNCEIAVSQEWEGWLAWNEKDVSR